MVGLENGAVDRLPVPGGEAGGLKLRVGVQRVGSDGLGTLPQQLVTEREGARERRFLHPAAEAHTENEYARPA